MVMDVINCNHEDGVSFICFSNSFCSHVFHADNNGVPFLLFILNSVWSIVYSLLNPGKVCESSL
jgi:hypothetical protein